MKTIKQYKEDIDALMDKASSVDAKAQNENRDLTADEVAYKDRVLDKVEELGKMVKTLERQDRVHRSLTVDPDETRESAQTVRPQIEMGEDLATKERFSSLGQQLSAVINAARPGGRVDPRLYNQHASGLNETVPSEGGFLVQTDFVTELLRQVWETGILAPRCRRIPISGSANSTTINGVDETSRATGSRSGGIRGYWAGEAEEKTASKPKFRQIELQLKKLIGLCYATDESLDDAAQLEATIRDGFGAEFGFLVDDAIIRGNGAGQPLGVLNSGALVTQDAEIGQEAGTVVPENVVNMYSRLFANSRTNAVWLINQQIEPKLHMMGAAVGLGGQLIYMPPGGLSQAPYGTLLGRPVIPIEQCSGLGTVGDIILGDFNNGYILAEKGGLKADTSIHVRFVYDEACFRFVMRIDGQPVRASVLTPYQGTDATQSHFVALAARS